MEAVRTLKANLKLEGKPCGWCQAALKLGDDAAVCAACEKEHHRGCWEAKAGCATAGCAGAPLHRLDVPSGDGQADAGSPGALRAGGFVPGAAPVPAGVLSCPRCGLLAPSGTQLCPGCRAITSPDGIYHGPRTTAPGAVKSLVYGLLGLLVCGIVFGPLAISSANRARDRMAKDPSLDGGGLATAGKVLGILDLVLFAVFLLFRMAAFRP